MLNEFIKIYNLSKDSVFKRAELEDALIEEYNCLHYSKLDGWQEKSTGIEYPTLYYAHAKESWGDYEISSGGCLSPKDALIDLFIKHGKEKTENDFETEDAYYTYMDNYNQSNKLKRIVRRIYE